MLNLVSRWFEDTRPSQDYRRRDLFALGLILALGAAIRFYGLDNVGLHGDEETMAMPAMAILEAGEPVLPSGMYYPRALLQIYLMAGSVWTFGESEWAFRLPSAVVGSLTGLAAFFMGRRFLAPGFNLAFVATIVLLPGMIVISQTARMYIFFVTCLIWFGACVFRWERDQALSSLLLALLVWALALHFQALAIFAAPLFLFPGLSRQSVRTLLQGGAAFVVGGALFHFSQVWIGSKYPERAEQPPRPEEIELSSIEVLASQSGWLIGVVLAAALLLFLLMMLKSRWNGGLAGRVPVAMVGLGLLALAFLHYHVGGILLVLGSAFWVRTSPASAKRWLPAVAVLAVTVTAAYVVGLHQTGSFPGRSLIGALVGTPSVWPILRFLEYSPVAGLLYAVVLGYGLAVLARGGRLPMHFLFFSMAVWAPLLLIGYFVWYIPPRYAQGQLGYFLMCVFAGLAFLAREKGWSTAGARKSKAPMVALAIVVLAVVNPIALARAINSTYGEYPDHKGAAEYIRSLELPDEAVLIAEDVLQQGYYLGTVDYSLRPVTDAYRFSVIEDGRWIDQYIGVPVIGSGEQLDKVLDANQGSEVYIIGSGENFVDGRRLLRGQGIREVLESDRLAIVYEGRDEKTKVWKLKE